VGFGTNSPLFWTYKAAIRIWSIRLAANLERTDMGNQHTKPEDDHVPVWGARNIGKEINRSPRQAFHLLESGKLPAKKVGSQWVSTRGALRRSLTADLET
jgi:hypothetical protein